MVSTTPTLVLIDNYDSFTYNLVDYFHQFGVKVKVLLNDQATVAQIIALQPNYLCISPGPGCPDQAGVTLEVIHYYREHLPILGVCLGHQAIAQSFGAKIIAAKQVMHGKVSAIETTQTGIFYRLPQSFKVVRYHSLAVEKNSLPDCLEITAWTADGEIMALRHKNLPIESVQFHPESILSENGHLLIYRFLQQYTQRI